MGDIADSHVNNFLSGRWGIPIKDKTIHPTTTKAAIADNRFKIVLVLGGVHGPCSVPTNRIPGTKLIVCDKDEKTYWVWASNKVTGIAKGSCKILDEDMSINEALAKLGRKLYHQNDAETDPQEALRPAIKRPGM